MTQAVCELPEGRRGHGAALPRLRHPRALRAGHGDRARGAGRQRRAAGRRPAVGYTPTPVVSHAILTRQPRPDRTALADGIVVTPSHNPPRDGGFKYNPPHGGPADTDVTR